MEEMKSIVTDVFSVPMPVLPQHGDVIVGPGAKKVGQQLGLGLPKISAKRENDVNRARKYARNVSVKKILERQLRTQMEKQEKQQMYAQAVALMSKIYIGSISVEVDEETLRKTFEQFGTIRSFILNFCPITGQHKGFGFISYELPDAAALAVESMNGQKLRGRILRVIPQETPGVQLSMPHVLPMIDLLKKEARKYNRIYVASVHPDLTETDLTSVFEAFGQIVKCQLAWDSNRKCHKGFGYIEFNNQKSQEDAISGMNMFDFGGKLLKVGKSVTPPDALSYLQPATILEKVSGTCAAITAQIMAVEAVGR